MGTYRKPKKYDYNQPNPSPYPGKALGSSLGKSPPDLSPNALPVNGYAPLDPAQMQRRPRGLPPRRLNVGPGNLG